MRPMMSYIDVDPAHVVTAMKEGREVVAPELPARAEFRIIETSDLIRLDRRVSQSNSKVVRGVLYARAGLLDQSEQEFQSYLEHHPADEQAKKLLHIIKSWRIR